MCVYLNYLVQIDKSNRFFSTFIIRHKYWRLALNKIVSVDLIIHLKKGGDLKVNFYFGDTEPQMFLKVV